MPGWVIVVDLQKDLPNADTPHKVITTKDYLARPQLFRGDRPKIINLSRSYAYQSQGYYASLLAEARGHRVMPTVETILELSARGLYEHALPELEDTLNKTAKKAGGELPGRLMVCFGAVADPRFERFGRLLFDWFRCPIIEVTLKAGEWTQIERLKAVALNRLTADEVAFFHAALDVYSRREWRRPKVKEPLRYTFAALHDPKEELPPTSVSSLRYWARVAEKLGVEVEPITKRDLARLAEYDALFIRETTSIDNHTFRFARRAQQEGMPVIDDPVSMIRCTNKLFLNELLTANGIPVPPTVMLASTADLDNAANTLGFPMVIKIPDGSFSRGVKKVDDRAALEKLVNAWFEDTDLLLAQKFMPTDFDWRVGVLDGQPLFVVQYLMAKKHWQIVNHEKAGKPDEGGFKPFSLEDAPPAVVDIGVKAARLIGRGLYGVDLKETDQGVYVIEVNDNPNIEHGVEDAIAKDDLWIRLTRWFIDRIEQRR